MPTEIVTRDGTAYRFRQYELRPPGPRDVRVHVHFAAPKHGTELHALRGSAFNRKRWDSELRLFLPNGNKELPNEPPAERAVGNIVVGVVTEVGPDVTLFAVGDRVFGYGPIREEYQSSEDRLRPIQDLSDVDAVCVDPAHVAFVAVRDGNIRIGDVVAVYGLGAIGLLAVQIARAGGARRVFVVDPLAKRRSYALEHGADAAFDPTACDAALEIKRATAGKGVDAAIETSGSANALHDAIRCIRQCGTVVHVSWGPHDCTALHLDEEFHLNRPTLIGSQAWDGWGNPDRSHPLWDYERAYQSVIDLFGDNMLTGEGIVTPIVPFAQAPEALAAIAAAPQTVIKVGVAFTE